MTTKKRIYDLAKEYGMSGQDLAKKLRDLGFSQVKSHMTALDDFEVLQIQGVLEAHGVIQESHGAGDESGGGLILRKKKKKRVGISEGEAEVEEAAAEAPPIEAPPETKRPEPPATKRAEPSVTKRLEPPAPPPIEELRAPAHAAPDADLEPDLEDADEAPAADAPELEAVESAPEAYEDVAIAAEPEVLAPAAQSTEEEPGLAVAPEEAEAGAERPATKRMGKVVGFIDLSKIQTKTAKKTESRRLRSKDDVAPDVQPTLSHDRSRALMRSDRGARGQLSAAELREREAARFLRRRGPTTTGMSRTARPPQRQREESASPYAGNRVRIEEPITIKKLAEHLSLKPGQLLQAAFTQGGIPFGSVNINSLIDEDTAVLLAHEFRVELEIVREVLAEEALITDLKKKRKGVDDEQLATRPPSIAFLGHVDHGKTTLIDTIRNSRVAEGEAGGITQHIGAYQVTTKRGHHLTILDTPGHEAFTAMRARGAKAVDIVVLVVAADDGVMPSTEEAVNHARAAGTPIVVALTKMDKPDANAPRAIQQLMGLGLVSEQHGGETAMLEVSAVRGQGVEELLERVFLESEVLELRCHPSGPASGIVLEAEIQQGQGIVAHLLIQDGTLTRGDVILAGEGYGKVRSMYDDRGNLVDEAPPSMPVEVTGLSSLPGIGEPFYVVEELARAKEVAEERERKNRAMSLSERRSIDAHALLQVAPGDAVKAINVILRTDVQGSAEVLRQKLTELRHAEVEVRVLHSGVGAVTESDVLLGSSSNALIVAFGVGVNDKARQAAERAGLDIRNYSVIYEVLNDVRQIMEGSLAPELSEEVTGHVEIRRLFRSSKFGTIAGCFVTDGKIARDSKVRLLRDGLVVYTGSIASLRREKDDAKEVREGFECGVVLKDYQDIKEGDVVETYKVVSTKRTLDDTAGA